MTYFETYPEGINTGLKPVLKKEPTIHPTCIIKDAHVGDYTELMMHTYIVESSFDDYSYCAGNVQIIYSTVGKFCSIANSVRINPGNHPQWRVTQHHMTYRRVAFGFDETDDTEFFNWRRKHKCTIGHDVWIGHGAIIMPGVAIGHGAIIGSGAVVTKNIPPYAIAVGVPAKVIKYRFDEPTIQALLSIEWWNWDRTTLEKNFKELNDVPSFIEKFKL
jgi:phosphonate metabolism protein (transferase hexapeptide repeat family)